MANPWEFERHNTRYKVRSADAFSRKVNSRWVETEEIRRKPTIRLSRVLIPMRPTRSVCGAPVPATRLTSVKFNRGDYFAAVEDKNHSENVSQVLYPDDSTYSRRELRLRQKNISSSRDGILGYSQPPFIGCINLC